MNLVVTASWNFIPKENPRQKETIFIVYDLCLWSATLGNLDSREADVPNAKIRIFQLFNIAKGIFIINHGGKRGVELIFGSRKQKRN
jgi:hypothetical protein